MIAIKNMKMPTDCCECGAYIYIKHGAHTTKNICCIANRKIYVEDPTAGRPDFCPLVEMSKHYLEILGSCWLAREDEL